MKQENTWRLGVAGNNQRVTESYQRLAALLSEAEIQQISRSFLHVFSLPSQRHLGRQQEVQKMEVDEPSGRSGCR